MRTRTEVKEELNNLVKLCKKNKKNMAKHSDFFSSYDEKFIALESELEKIVAFERKTGKAKPILLHLIEE